MIYSHMDVNLLMYTFHFSTYSHIHIFTPTYLHSEYTYIHTLYTPPGRRDGSTGGRLAGPLLGRAAPLALAAVRRRAGLPTAALCCLVCSS